jgi:hypothetical protein
MISKYRPLTNFGIEEDIEEPKEQAHLDYRYIKSYEGPMTKPQARGGAGKGIMKENELENQSLLKKKNLPKVLFSFERKKFGGIRMCQRCLRTKVTFMSS